MAKQEGVGTVYCDLAFEPHGGLLYWSVDQGGWDEVRPESSWMKGLPSYEADRIVSNDKGLLAAGFDRSRTLASMILFTGRLRETDQKLKQRNSSHHLPEFKLMLNRSTTKKGFPRRRDSLANSPNHQMRSSQGFKQTYKVLA
jgi:hypothetical protein